MSHSKGPWCIDAEAGVDCGYGRKSGAIVDAYGRAVVVADPSEGEYERAIDLDSEDARLIAAAPELLEALKAMQRQLRRTSASLWTNEQAEADLMACAAIAKATGEQA